MLKEEFPTLRNNPELAYFDNAASTQTHQSVLSAMNNYYENERCNIHRGDYEISRSVSDKVDTAREQIADLINTKSDNICFTNGATAGLNMVAEWFKDVETVFISDAEHTANILPWLIQGRTIDNGRLQVLPVDFKGEIDIDHASKLFQKYPNSLLSIVSTSNVTGFSTQWRLLAGVAKGCGLVVCIDACQTIGTHRFDVENTNIDFAVFSGHKMYGPTGIGVLYSRAGFDDLRPLTYGGGTVHSYNLHGNIEFYTGPMKHEAGTPNIAGMIGMGVAAEWINYTGYNTIGNKIDKVYKWLLQAGLHTISGISIPGNQLDFVEDHTIIKNILSITFDGLHPGDVGSILGTKNVAVRTGKLCAHPLVQKISNNGVMRISWGVYNTEDDCKKLVDELCKAINRLK